MAESVPVPSVVAPSMKVTVPVGTVVFPEGPETVAVKVTLAPTVMVEGDAESAVVLAASAGGGGGGVTAVQTVEFRTLPRHRFAGLPALQGSHSPAGRQSRR